MFGVGLLCLMLLKVIVVLKFLVKVNLVVMCFWYLVFNLEVVMVRDVFGWLVNLVSVFFMFGKIVVWFLCL